MPIKYFLAAILGSLLSYGGDHSVRLGKPGFSPGMHAKTFAASFHVHITSDVEPPLRAGQTFTLEANITKDGGSGDFEFMWWLPEGVQVVSGVEDPSLTFNFNGSAQTKITLMISDSSMNYQIVGEAYRFVDGSVQGFTAQFNTNPSALPAHQKLAERKKHRIVQ